MPNRPARNPDSAPVAINSRPSSTMPDSLKPAIAIPLSPRLAAPLARVLESCFRYTSEQRPSTPSIAAHLQGSSEALNPVIARDECRFGFADIRRCAGCFDFVNRNHLTRSRRARVGPQTVKKADDRKDRTTAFTAFADLSLDADDDAVHRPSRHRPRALFRHAAARLVADRGRLRPRPPTPMCRPSPRASSAG